MGYIPVTPFRRTVEFGVVKDAVEAASAEPLPKGVDKWVLLDALRAARTRIGVSDRELCVLQALLSFHPHTEIGGDGQGTVVFPSNAALSERLNGMPNSTLRRHLARLVGAGVLVRRDSPNGKRYVRRYQDEAPEAFGFDLAPLARRLDEILMQAEACRLEAEALRRLRQRVSLMRRDLAGLASYGVEQGVAGHWEELLCHSDELRNALRRKLRLPELEAMERDLRHSLDCARRLLNLVTTKISANDARSERHYQNSKTDSSDSEICIEKDPEAEVIDEQLPDVPFGQVVECFQEARAYLPDKIRHWHDILNAADLLRPMMGISLSAWQDATRLMGAVQAAVVLLAMLERQNEIRSPGGYLRALTAKAENGVFSCGPMIRALARRSRTNSEKFTAVNS